MIKLQKLYIVALAVLYFILFCFTYINSVSPVFQYMGLVYEDLSMDMWIWIFFISITPSFWLYDQDTRPSSIIIWFLYAVVFLPSIIVPVFIQKNIFQDIVILDIVLYVGLFIINSTYYLKRFKISRIRLEKDYFFKIVGCLYILLSLYIFSSFGFNFHIFNLAEVYEVRNVYKEAMKNIGGVIGYLTMWLGNTINTFFLLMFLMKRMYIWAGAVLIVQILLVSISAFKAWLFLPILIIIVYMMKKWAIKTSIMILVGINFFIVIGYISSIYFDNIIFESLFTRRMLMIPGLLTGYYYEFFSANGYALFSHSILSYFIEPIYLSAPPIVIGETYFTSGNNANASLFMDGYANLGYFGIIAMSALLAVVIYIYDSLTININQIFSTVILVPIAMSLSNGALLTNLLTGGFLLLILIVWLMPENML